MSAEDNVLFRFAPARCPTCNKVYQPMEVPVPPFCCMPTCVGKQIRLVLHQPTPKPTPRPDDTHLYE